MQPANSLERHTIQQTNGEEKMDPTIMAAIGTLIPIAGIAFVTIAVWLDTRRREREFLHRNELYKKIAETQGDAAQQVLEMIKQQEEEAQIRRREGMKLGGLIILAAGIGLMIFLFMYDRFRPLWAVGLMPIFVGAAIAVYALFLAPEAKRGGQSEIGNRH
jgi:Flp pilus assembly protein TadB